MCGGVHMYVFTLVQVHLHMCVHVYGRQVNMQYLNKATSILFTKAGSPPELKAH